MSPLTQLIRREIESQGPISFARFMELALYHPAWGYYERPDTLVGREGDYFTNVSVGQVFGELLGFRLARWLSRLPEPEAPLHLVEAGAHDGRLAADILGFLETHEPALFERLEYWLLEPSVRRRGWQAERLQDFQGRVHWAGDWQELPRVRGVLFSNELLDALPVHRLVWRRTAKPAQNLPDSRLSPQTADRSSEEIPSDPAVLGAVGLGKSDLAGCWKEVGIGWVDGGFGWTELPGEPADFAPQVPAELAAALPEGFIIEVGTDAVAWWRQAAAALDTGWLLTIDYGDAPDERFHPSRLEGTLRAYREHRASLDVLANPGSQDVTAHVDFGAVCFAGEAEGLKTVGLWRQEQYLADILRDLEAGEARFPGWTPARLRQCRTLLHPALLGSSFKVLVQSRGMG